MRTILPALPYPVDVPAFFNEAGVFTESAYNSLETTISKPLKKTVIFLQQEKTSLNIIQLQGPMAVDPYSKYLKGTGTNKKSVGNINLKSSKKGEF